MAGQIIVRRVYESLCRLLIKQPPLPAPFENHSLIVEIIKPIIYGWHYMAGLQTDQAAFVTLCISCDPVVGSGLDRAIFGLYNVVS